MIINEEFWGGTEQRQTWLPGVETTNYTLRNAFNEAEDVTWTLPFNEELDISISPWAINKDADIVKLAYPVSHRIGNSGYNWAAPKFYSVHDFEAEPSGIPFYFAAPYYTGGAGYDKSFNWSRRNGLDQAFIDGSTANNYGCNLYPVTNFDYSKLCVSLYVEYSRYPEQTDRTDRTYFDYYFNNWSAADRAAAPIVGIGFQIWGRGWDSNYPNAWRNVHPVSGAALSIHSLGRKKPCEIAPSGAGIGYNVDFMDDFMALYSNSLNGLTIGTWKDSYGGNGAAYIYNTSTGVYVQSYEESAAAELITSATNHPIVTVPMLEGEETNPHWTIVSNWAGEHYVKFKTILDASSFANEEELKAYILKQAAYLGMWFCTNGTPTGDPGSSESWYLGEIGEDGVTTGNYKKGASTAELDNSTWTDPWEESGWSGRPEDPNKYDKDLQTLDISGVFMGGENDYIMTPLTYREFIVAVEQRYVEIMEQASWTPETAEAMLLATFGTTENPLSLIKFARQFPFDLGNLVSTDAAATIRIGNTDIDAPLAPSPLPATYCEVRKVQASNWTQGSDYQDRKLSFETDNINYFKQFNSFLDYEPYSCAELWVPWCGTVKIDPQIYCGHNIGVYYSVDIESGQIKGQIFRDQLQTDEIKGTVGTEIPLDYASYKEILNAQIQAQATEQANRTKFAAAIGQVGMTLAGLGITAATMGMGAPVSAAATASLATASTAAQRSMAAARISDMTNAAQKANTTTAMGMGMQALGTVINAATSIASANNYHVNPGGVTFREIGASNGRLSITEYEPFLRLNTYRPKFLNGYTKKDFGLYGHQVGFACLKYDQLKNYSGLTCCGSVDLSGIKVERQGQISIVPTQEEIDIIRKSLQTGVYLP